jgi:hypothetical protein
MANKFTAFNDESQSSKIGDLTIENRVDRIEFYGSFEITRDQAGLALASQLQTLLENIRTALLAETLPAHVKEIDDEKVKNPFA